MKKKTFTLYSSWCDVLTVQAQERLDEATRNLKEIKRLSTKNARQLEELDVAHKEVMSHGLRAQMLRLMDLERQELEQKRALHTQDLQDALHMVAQAQVHLQQMQAKAHTRDRIGERMKKERRQTRDQHEQRELDELGQRRRALAIMG